MKKILVIAFALCGLSSSTSAQGAAPKQGKPSEKTEVQEAHKLRRGLEEKQLHKSPEMLGGSPTSKVSNKQCTKKKKNGSSTMRQKRKAN